MVYLSNAIPVSHKQAIEVGDKAWEIIGKISKDPLNTFFVLRDYFENSTSRKGVRVLRVRSKIYAIEQGMFVDNIPFATSTSLAVAITELELLAQRNLPPQSYRIMERVESYKRIRTTSLLIYYRARRYEKR